MNDIYLLSNCPINSSLQTLPRTKFKEKVKVQQSNLTTTLTCNLTALTLKSILVQFISDSCQRDYVDSRRQGLLNQIKRAV